MLAFQGKVCMDKKILERFNKFLYFSCTVPYQGEADISNKIAKCTKTTGVISNVLKPSLTQRQG
jgi:hypothetical protein